MAFTKITPADPSKWGSYISLGTRVGIQSPPVTNAVFQTGSVTYTQPKRRGSYLDQWGPGALQSAICTYRICPGQNQSPSNNPDVAFVQNISQMNPNQLLTLTGSTEKFCASFLVTDTSANASSFLQFDYPRSISVWASGGAATLDVNLVFNIYGSDWYGESKTYQMTLPSGTYENQITDIPTAFYKINAIKNVTPTDSESVDAIAFSTGFNFGLPYRLDQEAHVLGYSQSDEALSQTGSSPNFVWSNIEASYFYPNHYDSSSGLIIPFQLGVLFSGTPGTTYTAPQSITSGDNRGFFRPNMITDWVDGIPGGTVQKGSNFILGSIATLTYYVAGADWMTNQIKDVRSLWYTYPGQNADNPPISVLGFQLFGEQPDGNEPFQNMIPDPNDISALKGACPYYEAP